MKLLLQNATLIPMDSEDSRGLFFTGDLAVDGDRIAGVGRIPEDFTPDRTIDATSRVVLPGFVNSHTHAAMVLLRGYADDLPLMRWLEEEIWPAEAKLTAADVYQGTLLGIAEMIRSGTTSFLDMYFFQDEVGRAIEETGMRGVLSRGLIGFDEDIDEKIADNVAMKERFSGRADGRVSVLLGPHAPYTCMPEVLGKIIRAARDNDMGIHIHVAETAGEVADARRQWNKSPVKHLSDLGVFDLPTVAAHCVHVDEEDMVLLNEKNVSVAHNPESNLKLASGIAPVTRMLELGINVSIGTDGASSNNNLDLLEELHVASMLAKVQSGDATALNAYQALQMATVNGARALGFTDVGMLREGWKADFIVVDTADRPHLVPGYNPVSDLVYSAKSSDIAMTVVNGRILMEDRKLLTVDLDTVTREVQAIAVSLAKG